MGSNKRDVSYQPTLSEDEEAYDDDYFSSSSEDGDEFVLEMAARYCSSSDIFYVFLGFNALFSVKSFKAVSYLTCLWCYYL